MTHPYSNPTRPAWQGQALLDGDSIVCPECDGDGSVDTCVRNGWWDSSNYVCPNCEGSGFEAAPDEEQEDD